MRKLDIKRAYQSSVNGRPLKTITNRRNINDEEAIGDIPNYAVMVVGLEDDPPGTQNLGQCQVSGPARTLKTSNDGNFGETKYVMRFRLAGERISLVPRQSGRGRRWRSAV